MLLGVSKKNTSPKKNTETDNTASFLWLRPVRQEVALLSFCM